MNNSEKSKNMMNSTLPSALPASPTAHPASLCRMPGSPNSSEVMTVSKAEWNKLLHMLETLNATQAELSRSQTELIQQLSRANARIQELEAEKARHSSADALHPPPPVSSPSPSGPVPSPISPTVGFQYRPRQQSQANVGDVHNPPKQKTWAQIAATPRPKMSDLTEATQARLRSSRELLNIATPEPKPVALYFRNIKRAPLGHVRKALRQMFGHPWATLGLSFIGHSVLEIICHSGLVNEIVAKLRIVGAMHLKKFDIFGDNLKKSTASSSSERTTANLERAQARLERLVATCTNRFAKSWYSAKLQEAESRVGAKYNAAHDEETSVSDASGYDSDEVVMATDAPQPATTSQAMDIVPPDPSASSSPTQ